MKDKIQNDEAPFEFVTQVEKLIPILKSRLPRNAQVKVIL